MGNSSSFFCVSFLVQSVVFPFRVNGAECWVAIPIESGHCWCDDSLIIHFELVISLPCYGLHITRHIYGVLSDQWRKAVTDKLCAQRIMTLWNLVILMNKLVQWHMNWDAYKTHSRPIFSNRNNFRVTSRMCINLCNTIFSICFMCFGPLSWARNGCFRTSRMSLKNQ
jgi:hypothetical protein